MHDYASGSEAADGCVETEAMVFWNHAPFEMLRSLSKQRALFGLDMGWVQQLAMSYMWIWALFNCSYVGQLEFF